MAPVRILLSADTVGGVFTYACDLVRGLRERDVEVVVATFGDALSPAQRTALAGAGPAAVHESTLRLEWMEQPWGDVAAARAWLLELAARERVDLVHLNGYAHAAADWPVPVLVGAHSCVLSWWRGVHDADAPAAWQRYKREVRAGLRRADAVVAPSVSMLADVDRFYGPLGAVMQVIPNGSSAPAAPAQTPKEPFVLGAGRLWDDAKNLGLLDRAAAALPFEVRVAGPLGDRTPRHARALGPLDAEALRA
ncbi:MAG: glycosyl transferase family 1, partial [Solirubrobacterales bacterium]|nr:glycosyl transferase family 1 [Solirubrobacterales bacterium]